MVGKTPIANICTDTVNRVVIVLIIIFALSPGRKSHGLGVSHVFVHEDITWDLSVL